MCRASKPALELATHGGQSEGEDVAENAADPPNAKFSGPASCFTAISCSIKQLRGQNVARNVAAKSTSNRLPPPRRLVATTRVVGVSPTYFSDKTATRSSLSRITVRGAGLVSLGSDR